MRRVRRQLACTVDVILYGPVGVGTPTWHKHSDTPSRATGIGDLKFFSKIHHGGGAACATVPPNIPNPGAPTGTAQASRAADKGSEQAMQMMGQMCQMAMQLPQRIGGMLTQAPQQLMQPLQQLAQPLQQITSMFGGKDGSDGTGAMPFSRSPITPWRAAPARAVVAAWCRHR
jgi:hypothetical protein